MQDGQVSHLMQTVHTVSSFVCDLTYDLTSHSRQLMAKEDFKRLGYKDRNTDINGHQTEGTKT